MDDLEASRHEFAQTVTGLALSSESNNDLMVRLEIRFGKEHCLLCGVGSTRRAYATPLGVTIKVQREDQYADPLTHAELEERGGDSYLPTLGYRRRYSNLREMGFAYRYPTLVPRQYGFLASFGVTQTHPSVIICETVKTLNRYIRGIGVLKTDIGLDRDGQMHIFDSRFTDQRRPDDLIPFEMFGDDNDPHIHLSNIGVTASGRFVFCDRSDNADVSALINPWNISPWNGTPAREFSTELFNLYQKALQEKTAWQQKEADQTSQPEPTHRLN